MQSRSWKVKELNALISRHLEAIHALVPRPNPAYREGVARATLSGWTGNKDALLAIGEGGLVVESSGKDPWLVTREVPAGRGPFTLEMRMRSTGAGKGQVFWATAGQRNFHRDRSVTFQVTHDGAWHDHALKLPVEEAITALRIDPGAAPGEMTIRDLRLKDVDGKTIKEWDFRGG